MTSTSPTETLAAWIASVKYEDIPDHVVKRAKYLFLDGLTCALVGAHLPWSEKAARAIKKMDPAGPCTIIGHGTKTSPLSAALINGTFLQGFELDDWHSEAPLHSNAILIPALLAACEQLANQDGGRRVTGKEFLLALIVGYEVGPRVGRGLWGTHILSQGWHSGAVFGPSASAAACAKVLGLSGEATEDALGTACTQACGLMSAQFESEVKRMQHGFAARNGLLAALLAEEGYVGIKKVYEREYGGFLKQFSLGNKKTPQYKPEEVCKDLGSEWKTLGVNMKPYAAMAGTHATIDCVKKLKLERSEEMKDLRAVKKITINMGEAAYEHGGWKAQRPLTATGAQMSNAYICATEMVDGQVLTRQFRNEMLERDKVWRLVDVTTCVHAFGEEGMGRQRVELVFEDGHKIEAEVQSQKGVHPALSNGEITEKDMALMKEVIDDERAALIQNFAQELDESEDVGRLSQLLVSATRNPIA